MNKDWRNRLFVAIGASIATYNGLQHDWFWLIVYIAFVAYLITE